MNKSNTIYNAACLFVLCFLSAAVSFAQTDRKEQAEPSFEVVLQVVTGSNETAQKSSLPANLSAVTKNLKNNFSFSNYNLSSTYIGRVANTGNIDYKTVSSNFGQNQNAETPSFLEWSLGNLRSMANASGQNTIQLQPFRFGARMPIVTASYKEESGKTNSVVNYESIGLTLQRVSLPVNAPTLIGTLSTPKANETIFLVLTVIPVKD
jgi:hypothetical protein